MPRGLLLPLLLTLLWLGAAQAAPVSDPVASGLLSLEQSLKQAEGSTKPDTALLDTLRARLEAIRQEQTRLQQARERIEESKRVQREGTQELAHLLAQARQTRPQPVPDGLSSERLTALLEQASADEKAAAEQLEASKLTLSGMERRLPHPPPTPASPPPATAGEPALLARAAQLLAQVRQQAVEAESQAFALEQSTQPLRMQLAQAGRQWAERQHDQAREFRERIQEALNEQRIAEAKATQQSADSAVRDDSPPLLKRLAETNQSWADRLTELTRRLTDITGQREEVARQTDALGQSMTNLRQRLEQLGLGPVIGNLLLEKRGSLPSDASLQKQIKDNRTTINDIQLLDLDLADARDALAAPNKLAMQLLAEAPAAEQLALTPDVLRLLDERSAILDRLDTIKPPLLLAVSDLEYALQTQRRVVGEFSVFIAENLLWMPNARPLWRTAWSDYEHSLGALFDFGGAWLAFRDILREMIAQPTLHASFLILIATLMALRPTLRARIRRLADRPFGQPGETLWTTVGAIGLVLLFALPWPLLIAGIGLRLQESAPPRGLAQGIGEALTLLAPLLLYARASLALFHPNGLAERHFGWSPQNLKALREALHLFIWGVLPFGFLAALAISMDTEVTREGAGRLAFMVALLMMSVMFGRLLHPRGGVMLYFRMTHARHWATRLAPLWFVLGCGIPLLFAALAAVGYFYSAGVLTEKLIASLWISLGLLVVYDFGLRALRLAQRRLESQREHQTPTPAPRPGGESEGVPLQQSGLDISQISRQSRDLLRFSMVLALLGALYAVWAPILPALGVFDQIALWDYQGEIKGDLVTISVSLGDALLSALMLVVMWIAARNLPGLMEIMLEQWTGQDAGTRYAVITITRYLIVAVGLVLILGGLGLQWSQMQWLVAALGVGLGFGLQEIFANFISGLIILFERPVRVGDLVSIGEHTGFIKRIHIRATVLEDFDRKEIVVPNKKLITEQVTNWTLSDTSTRVLIDVGVAYGTDPRKVEAILVEAAKSVDALLPDPAPLVWFMGFGDSALNFRLRAFVGDADNKLGATSELHYAIEKALRDHGISIPFPQRDIHIRDITGIAPALLKEPKPT
ncbi:MAG: mechanosensitive ion channel domain-containing protein [Pseudomonadota bacterium]